MMIGDVRFGQVWEFTGPKSYMQAIELARTLSEEKPERNVTRFSFDHVYPTLKQLLANTPKSRESVHFVATDDDALWIQDQNTSLELRKKLKLDYNPLESNIDIVRELHNRALREGNIFELKA